MNDVVTIAHDLKIEYNAVPEINLLALAVYQNGADSTRKLLTSIAEEPKAYRRNVH